MWIPNGAEYDITRLPIMFGVSSGVGDYVSTSDSSYLLDGLFATGI